jgi:putative ABC transport system permease protein
MTWRHRFKTAVRGLSTNRSRSLLTILGIVIGITAIILVVSLGAGAQNLILGQVQGLGTNTIAIIPGKEPSGISDTAQLLFSDSLKYRDVISLGDKGNLPNLKLIMPTVFGAGNAYFQSNTYSVTIFGVTELVEGIFDMKFASGEIFTADEVVSRADVVVIGSKINEKLFEGSNAVGQKIKIKNRNFRVVGVLKETGGGSLFNFDNMAIMPYTTAQDYLLGFKYFNRIIIQTERDDQVAVTVEDIKRTLRENHNITDPEKDDFTVQTQQDLADRLSTITSTLTWFLVAVASIALFVGGVGIMNIMLVAVTERTREIGLRKALGATDGDILWQFLIEAILLTVLGGLIGIFIGSSLAFIVSLALSKGLNVDWAFVFPWGGAALGFFVSASIGLIFGSYPAKKASAKSPIEALRYE